MLHVHDLLANLTSSSSDVSQSVRHRLDQRLKPGIGLNITSFSNSLVLLRVYGMFLMYVCLFVVFLISHSTKIK